MTQTSSPLPSGSAQPDLPMAENPWLTLWRTFWFDLPLAWAGEADRLLFRWMDPPATGKPAAGGREGDGQRHDAPSRGDALPDGPVTAMEAAALGLGCGDYSKEVLG